MFQGTLCFLIRTGTERLFVWSGPERIILERFFLGTDRNGPERYIPDFEARVSLDRVESSKRWEYYPAL